MKRLYNISNHPSVDWGEEQREGWDEIYDVPFPQVDPTLSWRQVEKIADELLHNNDLDGCLANLEEGIWDRDEIFIMIQGEFTLSFILYQYLERIGHVAIPTTQRVETIKDGVKTSIFKFVRWRIRE